MKRYVIIPVFILMQIAFIAAANTFKNACLIERLQPGGLSEYTGKYEMKQGTQTVTSDLYIENGKLTAKSSDGGILTLDHLSGDNFVVSKQGTAIKFMRDRQNKVTQIAVSGAIAWTRTINKTKPANNTQPTNLPDYAGKYQATANGHILTIEVSIKNGQLWATQLWDNASSALDFASADNFIVNALSVPLRFTRDSSKKVTQLVLNGSDIFAKTK